MPRLVLSQLTKRFGATVALDRVDLVLPDQAFVALLGPSGCGKTTLLRLLAGFEAPSEGSIAFGGTLVASPRATMPPETRAVSMVFQSYALWPHMTVEENVAYPLVATRRPAAEVAARVARVLDRVGLKAFADRRPDSLSGGQRQRVALARALVADSDIVLFDEPLANLDPHLRAAMMDEFAALHAETGRTFVYVTHDQAEALALASHLAVMAGGRIAQFAAPDVVYRAPATATVARFIGLGAMITAPVDGLFADGQVPVTIGGHRVLARAATPPVGAKVAVLIRPEALSPGGAIPLTVRAARYLGPVHAADLALDDGQILKASWPSAVRPGDPVQASITDAWVLPEPVD